MSARNQAIERVAFERNSPPEDLIGDPKFWEEVNAMQRMPDLLDLRIEEAVMEGANALQALYDEIVEFGPEIPDTADYLGRIETYLGAGNPDYEPPDTMQGE